MKNRILSKSGLNLFWLGLLGIVAGCAEQPYGYVFSPKRSDEVNVARQAVDFVASFYDHADQTAVFLADAGLTTDYRSILPDGWVDSTRYDSLGLPMTMNYYFFRNYLDKQYYFLTIPVGVAPSAIRNPSTLNFDFIEISSVQNNVTNDFLGRVNQSLHFNAYYSDNLTNTKFIDGWFSISKIVKFDQEIEVSVGGRSSRQTFAIYLNVPWTMKVEHFSTDPNDQRGRVVIEGIFPILDENNNIQRCHTAGEFTFQADGSGTGTVRLYGEETARIRITGRAFEFSGTFTLSSENHEKVYTF